MANTESHKMDSTEKSPRSAFRSQERGIFGWRPAGVVIFGCLETILKVLSQINAKFINDFHFYFVGDKLSQFL